MATPPEKKESVTKNDPIIPLTGEDWEHVYEPAEDTYLFMVRAEIFICVRFVVICMQRDFGALSLFSLSLSKDALEKELPDLRATRPAVIMEIGCGSGCISAFLAKILKGPAYIATGSCLFY